MELCRARTKERDWIFYPKDTIDQLTLLSHTNDRVAASDGQHWAIEAKFRWRTSSVLEVKRASEKDAFKLSQMMFPGLVNDWPELQSEPMEVSLSCAESSQFKAGARSPSTLSASSIPMEAEPSQAPVSLNQPALVQLSLAKSPSNLVIGENEDLSGPSPL